MQGMRLKYLEKGLPTQEDMEVLKTWAFENKLQILIAAFKMQMRR